MSAPIFQRAGDHRNPGEPNAASLSSTIATAEMARDTPTRASARFLSVSPPPKPSGEPYHHFSSNTRSSIGRVIFTFLPVISTTASSPVVECPVGRMKNLSAA